MILAKNINLSSDSVRLIIERTAKKVGSYSYNINKPNGLWNNEMVYGRVDAKSALDFTHVKNFPNPFNPKTRISIQCSLYC